MAYSHPGPEPSEPCPPRARPPASTAGSVVGSGSVRYWLIGGGLVAAVLAVASVVTAGLVVSAVVQRSQPRGTPPALCREIDHGLLEGLRLEPASLDYFFRNDGGGKATSCSFGSAYDQSGFYYLDITVTKPEDDYGLDGSRVRTAREAARAELSRQVRAARDSGNVTSLPGLGSRGFVVTPYTNTAGAADREARVYTRVKDAVLAVDYTVVATERPVPLHTLRRQAIAVARHLVSRLR